MSFFLLFYNLKKFNKVYRIKGLDILSDFEYGGFSMHILKFMQYQETVLKAIVKYSFHIVKY